MTPDSTIAAVVKPEFLVSVCALVPKDRATLERFIVETAEILEKRYRYYEIILIDNACPPALAEAGQLLLARVPNIRWIRLSRATSLDIAFSAAIDNSLGDYVFTMDAHCDPPSMLPAMMNLLMTGYDVVTAVSKVPESTAARLLYKFSGRILGTDMNPRAHYLRLFTRTVVNAITKVRTRSRFLIHLTNQIGFRQTYVEYTPADRTGRPFGVMQIVELIVANSAMPLRLAALLGFGASLINLLYLFYILSVVLVKKRIAEGWLTTSLMNTTMFLMLFVVLGVLAEYVARILDESGERPLYFVEYESASSTSSFDKDRLNVF